MFITNKSCCVDCLTYQAFLSYCCSQNQGVLFSWELALLWQLFGVLLLLKQKFLHHIVQLDVNQYLESPAHNVLWHIIQVPSTLNQLPEHGEILHIPESSNHNRQLCNWLHHDDFTMRKRNHLEGFSFTMVISYIIVSQSFSLDRGILRKAELKWKCGKPPLGQIHLP